MIFESMVAVKRPVCLEGMFDHFYSEFLINNSEKFEIKVSIEKTGCGNLTCLCRCSLIFRVENLLSHLNKTFPLNCTFS